MRSSHIVAVDPATLVDASESGWAYLGTVGGVAYCTVSRAAPVERLLYLGTGNLLDHASYRPLTDGEEPPEDAIIAVVGERPPLPWGEEFTLVFDPSPEPFRWDDFAAAHPALASPLDSDEPGPLRPLVWAGE
jgi:hypothetical protein